MWGQSPCDGASAGVRYMKGDSRCRCRMRINLNETGQHAVPPKRPGLKMNQFEMTSKLPRGSPTEDRSATCLRTRVVYRPPRRARQFRRVPVANHLEVFAPHARESHLARVTWCAVPSGHKKLRQTSVIVTPKIAPYTSTVVPEHHFLGHARNSLVWCGKRTCFHVVP